MKTPKQLFLVDALGAFLSGLFLFAMICLDPYFMMPNNILLLLGGIAVCLFSFSISCHLFVKSHWRNFLKVIIICNSGYALISAGFVVTYYGTLTKFDIIYFILELLVLFILIFLEYTFFTKMYSNKNSSQDLS